MILLWISLTVNGIIAGPAKTPQHQQSLIKNSHGLPDGIDSVVIKYAGNNNCRIQLQIADPNGSLYNIGYDGRNKTSFSNFENEYIEIGSCTKMFTATSILQLIESGKLKLTDKLTDIFPGNNILRGMLVIDSVDYIDSVKVRNLLNHTSGLQDYFMSPDSLEFTVHSDSSLRFTPWGLLETAKKLRPAEFIPGSSFKYSNSNYILLGLIIEKLSGMSYAGYVRQNILKPLGMDQTYLPSSFSLPGKNDGHYNQKIIVMPPTLAWSAGEIVSTPGDMNKFIRGWYSGKLFSEKMCKEVRNNYFDNAPSFYEFGLGVMKGPENCYGHGGQTFGFQSYIGYTENGYSFAFGIDDAAVSALTLQNIIVYSLLSERK